MPDTKSNAQVISKYEKYFKVFLWLPLIYSAIVGCVMLAVGIVLCANVSGALIMVGIFGAPIMAALTYYFASILLSYRILHIYYLRKVTNSVSTDEQSSATAPDGLKSIRKKAHCGNSSLTSITIPDGVTSIEERAFLGCNNLMSITIPDSVTSIRARAFYKTGYYKDETNWENGVLYIGKHLIEAKTSISGSYAIKDGTLCIADNAFADCSSLKSVTIPNSVTSIGDSVFYGCSSLASVNIPNGVTSIGDSAFYYCSNLTGITIPNSVTSIGGCAFSGCRSLTSITIPDGVTRIGDYAFHWCSSLTSVTITESVKNIGSFVFEGCDSLTSIKYRGTQAQWNAISKGNWWFSNAGEDIITYDYNG